ncbi:MAG: hypothetical protein EOO60_00760 [Hymenobacter sp.]|nr:MAG: hypothetical protein EOO60_00760 [Hymenobacter sp.]
MGQVGNKWFPRLDRPSLTSVAWARRPATYYFVDRSLHAFQQCSPVMQRYWVLPHGTFLANRWEQEGSVNLYHCAGDDRGCQNRIQECPGLTSWGVLVEKGGR